MGLLSFFVSVNANQRVQDARDRGRATARGQHRGREGREEGDRGGVRQERGRLREEGRGRKEGKGRAREEGEGREAQEGQGGRSTSAGRPQEGFREGCGLLVPVQPHAHHPIHVSLLPQGGDLAQAQWN